MRKSKKMIKDINDLTYLLNHNIPMCKTSIQTVLMIEKNAKSKFWAKNFGNKKEKI